MIGMMYLVLTAMLALNVSKDAVEAFKNIDNSLTLTIRNYATKNNLIYQEFESSFAQYPEKTGPYRTKALEVKQRADELFDYLQGLKVEIITEADEPYAIRNGNEIYTDTIKRIDDNNVPSQILIGANDDGKAFFLRTAINDYRDWLISDILQGENPILEKGLRESLNTDDKWNKKKKELEKWPNYNFQALPLVYVITMLSKIQVDVRNAETEALNFLFSQIDKSSFKFNKLEAVVIPKSNYVTVGSSYEATVFISATDTTQQPTITIGDQRLDIDESGKGLYSARASSVGPKNYSGVISMQAPDGTIKPYKFDASYYVDMPNVVVSPTAMNVMYKGLKNPIDVSVPGVSPDKIRVKVNNGVSTQERIQNARGEYFRGSWAVQPDQVGKNVQIIVSTQDPSGKLTSFAPIEFRVKRLPDPTALFAQKATGNVTKSEALSQPGVFASLGADFDFELKYDVVGFTVSYSDRMGDRMADSKDWRLTEEQRNILNNVTRGRDLTIKNIRAKGPDGITRDLAPIVLTIQ
jgi:gliding motility-associated protein GldM